MSAARDLALVSFLQKFTGQTLTLPQPQPQAPPQIHHNNQSDPALVDPGCNRWPRQEVEALIKVRSGIEARFHKAKSKTKLWDQISSEMATMGFSHSPKRCKEKWENIKKYFRKAKDNSKEGHEKAIAYPYFQQLDDFYSNAILDSPPKKPDGNFPKTHTDSVTLNNSRSHHNHLILHETKDNSELDSTNEGICSVKLEGTPPDVDHAASSATHSSFVDMLTN